MPCSRARNSAVASPVYPRPMIATSTSMSPGPGRRRAAACRPSRPSRSARIARPARVGPRADRTAGRTAVGRALRARTLDSFAIMVGPRRYSRGAGGRPAFLAIGVLHAIRPSRNWRGRHPFASMREPSAACRGRSIPTRRGRRRRMAAVAPRRIGEGLNAASKAADRRAAGRACPGLLAVRPRSNTQSSVMKSISASASWRLNASENAASVAAVTAGGS